MLSSIQAEESTPTVGQANRITAVPSPESILRTGLGFWASKTLLTAVDLGLFTVLAEAPHNAEALRTRLGLHERSSLDFFDALVAMKFLQRQDGL